MKVTLIMGILAALSSMAIVAGCEEPISTEHDDATKRIRIRDDLMLLAAYTEDAMDDMQEWPPVALVAYSKWMIEADPPTKSIFRYDEKTGVFVDPWRRPIVLIQEAGALVGLGSCGPDGQWEEGEEDDVVTNFSEIFFDTEPPGTPWPSDTPSEARPEG